MGHLVAKRRRSGQAAAIVAKTDPVLADMITADPVEGETTGPAIPPKEIYEADSKEEFFCALIKLGKDNIGNLAIMMKHEDPKVQTKGWELLERLLRTFSESRKTSGSGLNLPSSGAAVFRWMDEKEFEKYRGTPIPDARSDEID